MTTRHTLSITLLAILLLSQFVASHAGPLAAQDPASGQDEGQAVELSSNLVTITVVARDASGKLVADLEPSDFTVYEDGVPQEVDQLFRQGEVPLRLALLFDASLSIKKRLDFEQRAANRFFSSIVGPGHKAALFSVSTQWKIEQPMTGSVGALVDATNRLEAGGTTLLFAAIQEASRYLQSTEGRRVMVVLSDGYDTSGKDTLAETLRVAQQSDVVIYTISPAGSGNARSAISRIGAQALRRMADETGGAAFFPPIEEKRWREEATLDGIYAQLADELRAQYVLTYYSSSASEEGELRKLRVEVKRPGVTVHARKGFYAS